VLILATDTSTATGGAALLNDGQLVGETMLSVRAVHSERLMPAVEWLLSAAGVKPGQLDGVCVGVGPGSFTGVRIAVSAAKAMAFALGVPLVGVSTLDALAAGRSVGPDIEVWSLIDARHGRCYSARYLVRGAVPEPERLSDMEIRTVDQLSVGGGHDDAADAGPTLFVGDGAVAYRREIVERFGSRACVAEQPWALLRPMQVGLVGAALLARGVSHSPYELVPQYLKPSEPEARAEQ